MKEKVLLLGNGIYRAFHGEEESWENVLKYVKKKLESEGLTLDLEPSQVPSNILYFEYLYSKWRAFQAKSVANKIINTDDAKENETSLWRSFTGKIQMFLKERFDGAEFKACVSVINNLVWNHFDVVLTTNIDNRLELVANNSFGKSMLSEDEEFLRTWGSKSGKKWKFSTYRRKENKDKKIFYLHGDVEKPASICFGLDHYLGEYRCQYDYLFAGEGNDKKEALEILNGGKPEGDNRDSWLDYFFFEDVDIVGLALSRDEIDLWWAIEKRFHYKQLRTLREKKLDKENVIRYFYPSCELERMAATVEMLRALDIVPVVIPCNSYREFYKVYFEDFA